MICSDMMGEGGGGGVINHFKINGQNLVSKVNKKTLTLTNQAAHSDFLQDTFERICHDDRRLRNAFGSNRGKDTDRGNQKECRTVEPIQDLTSPADRHANFITLSYNSMSMKT